MVVIIDGEQTPGLKSGEFYDRYRFLYILLLLVLFYTSAFSIIIAIKIHKYFISVKEYISKKCQSEKS